MNDPDLLDGFLAGTLESFPHEDHLRVTFLLVREHGVDAAIEIVSARIRAFAAAVGAPGVFHVTRTVAWARLVGAAAAHGDASDSVEFLARHPELVRRDLLDEYYSPGVLTSDAARTAFVEPDLRPLGR